MFASRATQGSEAARAAAKRGLALSGTTRHLRKDDLLGFDYILAMDDAVLSEISDASRSWGEPYASAANTKVAAPIVRIPTHALPPFPALSC
eukprot:SAG11_NODE_139_length_15111_cov_9.482214_3_plen_92_part_00